MQQQPNPAPWKGRVALFLLSQNISLFGSSVVGFAIIWYVTLETSSGFWLMLATICTMLPQVIVSLWGGVLADRYSRKLLIMAADGFIALATLALACAFFLGYREMGLLLAVLSVRSIGAGIQTPAVSAIYPQLVPAHRLTKVQGINQTLSSVLQLLAPAVGGALLGSVGIVWAFMVDVVTASIAILVMSFIAVERLSSSGAPASALREMGEGLRYAWEHVQLRRLLICYAFAFFLITPGAILSPLLVERTFGPDVWRLTANEMVWTVGSLIGGVFISLRGEIKNKVRAVAVCLVAFGMTFALLGVAWNFPVFLALMGIAGVFMPVIATAQTVHVQEITEPGVMGRVFSILQIIMVSAMPVGILLFGPLADLVPLEGILLVTGFLLVLVGLWYHWASRADSNPQ